MAHSHEESAAGWAEHASAALGAAGYRNGSARRAVLKVVGAQACALTVPEVESAINAKGEQPVSRATVYRVLEELDSLKLLTRIDIGDGHMRFEPALQDGHHHHHMVCDNCGDVIPFEDQSLENAISKLAKRSTFAVEAHEVVLRGSCAKCAA